MSKNCAICTNKLTIMNTSSFGGSKLIDGKVICTHCFSKINKINPNFASNLKKHSVSEAESLFEEKEKSNKIKEEKIKEIEIKEIEETERHFKAMNRIIVTTTDLKREYEILGPVYFQVSNRGIFSNALSKLIKKHRNEIENLKNKGQANDSYEWDWGFLYGELSFGMQNDFDDAFFVSVRELQSRAERIGADAIIGMKQDIDLDTNQFQNFYLQMYGTAVKFK